MVWILVFWQRQSILEPSEFEVRPLDRTEEQQKATGLDKKKPTQMNGVCDYYFLLVTWREQAEGSRVTKVRLLRGSVAFRLDSC